MTRLKSCQLSLNALVTVPAIHHFDVYNNFMIMGDCGGLILRDFFRSGKTISCRFSRIHLDIFGRTSCCHAWVEYRHQTANQQNGSLSESRGILEKATMFSRSCDNGRSIRFASHFQELYEESRPWSPLATSPDQVSWHTSLSCFQPSSMLMAGRRNRSRIIARTMGW